MAVDKKELEKDLQDLMDKHNIVISGCGCCESPFIYEVFEKDDKKKQIKEKVEHLISTI